MAILDSPRIRSGILLQGLYLVLLPLLFNCVLIGVLSKSVSEAEALIDESRRRIKVAHKLTHAIYVVTEMILGGNNALMNGKYQFFGPMLNTGWTYLANDLEEVSKNVTADATTGDYQAEINDLIERQKAIFANAKVPLSFDNVFIKMRRVQDWVRVGARLSNLLHAMQEDVREKYLHSLKAQKDKQAVITLIVIVGLTVNLLIALFLIRHFRANFVKQIDQLSKMAQMLPFNEPISETISGSEELQGIGVALAQVSWRLADVAEYRRSLMQMMAHDVRSPMMAAQISIVTLKKLVHDSLTSDGSASLSEGEKAISECLTLVNDLLFLESLENGDTKFEQIVCDIQEIVAAVVNNNQNLKNVTVSSSVDSIIAKLDKTNLTLIIERMLADACNRAPENSNVSITSEVANGRMNLTIRDQAPPLTPVECSNLFDKIYQAGEADRYRTNSLGLAVASKIAQVQNGSINCQSTAEGNSLALNLPLSQPFGQQCEGESQMRKT